MKLLTLACGLACGVGLAFAVQAAGSRGTDERQPDRRENLEEHRSSTRSNRRERDEDFDRDDERVDHRELVERGELRRPPRSFEDVQDQRWELASRDERERNRRGEEGGRPEFGGSRRGRDTAERRPGAEERRGDGPRGPEARRPEIGRPRRGQREFGERAPRGRREFANREPGRRPESHQRPERRGERFAEHRPGGYYGSRPPHFGPGFERPPFATNGDFGPGSGHPGFGEDQFAGHRPGGYGGPRPPHFAPGFGRPRFAAPGGFGPGSRHPGFGGDQFAGHRPGEYGGPQLHQGGPQFARQGRGPRPTWGGGRVPPHGSPFGQIDQNSDGKITKDEVMQLFAKVDVNGDGSVTREELARMVMSGGSSPANPHEQASEPNVHGAGRHQAGSEGHTDVPTQGVGPGGPGGIGDPAFRRGPGWFGPGPSGFGPGGRGPQFGGSGRPGFHGPSGELMMDRIYRDHNGFLTKDSVPPGLWDRISNADTNGDGKISKEELEAHFKSLRPQRPEAGGESTKPVDSPNNAKPEETKPEVKPTGNSPQAFNHESEAPADAIAASNVVR